MKKDEKKKAAPTVFEVADVTLPCLAVSKLCDGGAHVNVSGNSGEKKCLPIGKSILFDVRGGESVMRADVVGVCDGDIPESEHSHPNETMLT